MKQTNVNKNVSVQHADEEIFTHKTGTDWWDS